MYECPGGPACRTSEVAVTQCRMHVSGGSSSGALGLKQILGDPVDRLPFLTTFSRGKDRALISSPGFTMFMFLGLQGMAWLTQSSHVALTPKDFRTLDESTLHIGWHFNPSW